MFKYNMYSAKVPLLRVKVHVRSWAHRLWQRLTNSQQVRTPSLRSRGKTKARAKEVKEILAASARVAKRVAEAALVVAKKVAKGTWPSHFWGPGGDLVRGQRGGPGGDLAGGPGGKHQWGFL